MVDAIALEGVELEAGGRSLVRGLSARFAVGERWAVLGPNGVGKSTLLAALAGLHAPAAGSVRYAEGDVARLTARALARLRSYLPQRIDDAFSATVLDTVLLARHPHGSGWGFAGPEDHAIARTALSRFDAEHLADRDVRRLSGGERQRVALAATLAQETPILLLDEPTSHLDAGHQLHALDALGSLPDRLVVAVLHDLHLAARFATHAVLLDGRGTALAGPAHEILQEAPLASAFGLRFRRVQHGAAVLFWVDA